MEQGRTDNFRTPPPKWARSQFVCPVYTITQFDLKLPYLAMTGWRSFYGSTHPRVRTCNHHVCNGNVSVSVVTDTLLFSLYYEIVTFSYSETTVRSYL